MEKSGEDDHGLAETRRIMERLVKMPPKPHDQMVPPKRKGAAKPEKRMAAKEGAQAHQTRGKK